MRLQSLEARYALWDKLAAKMADGPAGFHFDELNKVRVLEPEISQQTQELKEECKEFVDSKLKLFVNCIFWSESTFKLDMFSKEDQKMHVQSSLWQLHGWIYMLARLFLSSEIGEFQKIVGGFIDMVDALAKEVEKEKMKVRFLVLINCL